MLDFNGRPEAVSSTVFDRRRPRRRVVDEAVSGDSIACTGKSCESCTAAVIADCVAVCCCPCAVVSLMALAFLRLPCAVARRCLRRRRVKQKQREWSEGDMDGISRKAGVIEGISENVAEEEMCVGFEAEEIWYEVGHLGFGRVSFTGVHGLNNEG